MPYLLIVCFLFILKKKTRLFHSSSLSDQLSYLFLEYEDKICWLLPWFFYKLYTYRDITIHVPGLNYTRTRTATPNCCAVKVSHHLFTPGKRSTCTPSVYCKKSIWLVTVYHLTCINKHVVESVSMFSVSLLYLFHLLLKIGKYHMLWQ